MSIVRSLAAALVVLTSPLAALAFSFVPGHFYSAGETGINQYNTTGTLLGTLPIATGLYDLRGIAFGPDGLLYVVRENNAITSSPARVDVINEAGTVVRSYAYPGIVSNNITYGKISFDLSGQSFYVGGWDGVYRFDVGGSSGALYLNTQSVFDVRPLANGQMLVATNYDVRRYSSSGQLLGTVSTLADPNGVSGTSFPWLVDVRGLEYDPTTNTTFVSMLGYSDFFFKIIALSGFSNVITGVASYTYGADMTVTPDGRLLVGSWTQAPGLFTTSLDYQGQFGGGDALFVAMMPVPEPSAALLLLAGLAGLWTRRRAAAQVLWRSPDTFTSGTSS